MQSRCLVSPSFGLEMQEALPQWKAWTSPWILQLEVLEHVYNWLGDYTNCLLTPCCCEEILLTISSFSGEHSVPRVAVTLSVIWTFLELKWFWDFCVGLLNPVWSLLFTLSCGTHAARSCYSRMWWTLESYLFQHAVSHICHWQSPSPQADSFRSEQQELTREYLLSWPG